MRIENDRGQNQDHRRLRSRSRRRCRTPICGAPLRSPRRDHYLRGNASVENTTRNALAILELAGIDVPVAAGCAEPLAAPALHTREMHGKTGLDGANIAPPTHSAIE